MADYPDFFDKTIGFIGAGNMASAIGIGLLKKGVVKPSHIYVSAPSNNALETWKAHQVNVTHDNMEVISKSEVVFLAFKPYQLDEALKKYGNEKVSGSKLYISILMGVPCDVIMTKVENISQQSRLIRAMPNLAVATGEGCTVITPDSSASEADIQFAKKLFSTLGGCEQIPESLMESVGVLVGSGPAYVYMFIEALADSAVKYGVPRQVALRLASHMVGGAAKMVTVMNKHPGLLKDEVCSPGGTTICGVHELERGNFRGTVMNALEAGILRARNIKSATSK